MQSVTNVVVERQGLRLTPNAGTITPSVYQNGFGVKRTASGGAFRFKIEHWRPGANIRILIAVEGGNPITCDLSNTILKRLR